MLQIFAGYSLTFAFSLFSIKQIDLEPPGSQPEALLKVEVPDGVYWEEQLLGLGRWGQRLQPNC